MKSFAFAIAIVLAMSTQAQTSAVPPSHKQQSRASDYSAEVQETAKNAAVALPGAIMQGGAVLQQQIGTEGSVLMLGAAKKGANIISYTVDGARVLGATLKDGTEGFKREGAQVVFERAAGAVADVGVGIATRYAIANGVSAVTAGGALGLAYTCGSLVGGWARDSKWLASKCGSEITIGEKVDNFVFEGAPDWTKELVSGVKQVDVDSPLVSWGMRLEAERQRRQTTFEAVQQANAQQERQLRSASQSSAVPSAATHDPDAGPDATGVFLNQLNQSLRQSQLLRQQKKLQRKRSANHILAPSMTAW